MINGEAIVAKLAPDLLKCPFQKTPTLPPVRPVSPSTDIHIIALSVLRLSWDKAIGGELTALSRVPPVIPDRVPVCITLIKNLLPI